MTGERSPGLAYLPTLHLSSSQRCRVQISVVNLVGGSQLKPELSNSYLDFLQPISISSNRCLIVLLNSNRRKMDYEALKEQWSEIEDRDGIRLSWNTFPSSRMVSV